MYRTRVESGEHVMVAALGADCRHNMAERLLRFYLFIISLVHEVQKRQKDRTDRTSASTQITDKNMHVTDSKNIR